MWEFIEDAELRKKVEETHNSAVTVINDGIASKITEATDGLSRKNAEILDEKKKLEKKYEGIDPDSVRDAVKFYEKNKDSKMIETGKLDELVEQKVSSLKADHDAVVGELNSNLKKATETATTFQDLYQTKVLEDELSAAAIRAKVLPEAVRDVVTRAKQVFSLSEDFKVEARDGEGNLLKMENDIIVTPKNWMEVLKSEAPYFWPASEGAHFKGKTPGGSEGVEHMNHLAKTDHAAFVAARKKQLGQDK